MVLGLLPVWILLSIAARLARQKLSTAQGTASHRAVHAALRSSFLLSLVGFAAWALVAVLVWNRLASQWPMASVALLLALLGVLVHSLDRYWIFAGRYHPAVAHHSE